MARTNLELYSLVKVFYDRGENFTDCFLPFVLEVLPDSGSKSLREVSTDIRSKYGLDIPYHVMEKIVQTAQSEDILEVTGRRPILNVAINEKGRKQLDLVEPLRNVERRINAATSSFMHYLSKLGRHMTSEKARALIDRFIEKNANPLLALVEGKKSSFDSSDGDSEERFFVEFLLEVEGKNPTVFETLREMILGAVIATVLNYDRQVYEGLQDRHFRKCKLYFDANYLFSLLALHADEFSMPARELFQLLKTYDFEFGVLDITIAEMSRVLRGYLKQHYKYPTTTRVDSIYSTLKTKGYTETDVIELIGGLEDRLQELKIGIKRTGIELNSYTPKNKDIFSFLCRYKYYQAGFFQNHDLAVLEKMPKYRKRTVRRFEDANTYFVTSDFKLARINYVEMGHKENHTIAEVILDRLLTNILFLKNPRGNLSIKSIISAYSRGLFVRRRIWEKFYETLTQARENKKIDERSVTLLFYNRFIERELSSMDDEQGEVINEEFVINTVEKAVAEYEKNVKGRLEDEKIKGELKYKKEIEKQRQSYERDIKIKENEFLEVLNSEKIKYEEEKEAEKASLLATIENNLREETKNSSRRIAVLVRMAVGIVLALPLIILAVNLIFSKISNENLMSLLSIIRYIVFVIDCFVVSIHRIWEKFEEHIFNKAFERKKKRIITIGTIS